jgi:DNA-binding NtrC family response regulator
MRILLAEDDDATRKGIVMFLRAEGYEINAVSGGMEALTSLQRESYDLIISDIRMPGMDGLTMLNRLRQQGVQTSILMITAYATVEEAVRALHAGADDYLTKPLNLDELTVRIQRIASKLSLVRENRQLKDRLQRIEFPQMVGAGKAMQEIQKSMDRLADDPNVPVMIYGESGTGKELVARTIHCRSLRSQQPFVDVSCAAFSDELLESEMFGYKKGAFTGAHQDKQGLLQAAHRGTLFLDEVADMSPRMQSRLLRFLQEHTFLPVGGIANVSVDARLIGASNQNLQDLVRAGKFREDLYYRMNVVEIHLRPLRERPEDIPLLVRHFIGKHSGNCHKSMRLTPSAYDCLEKHAWPGNVRELENLVRVLMVECEKEDIGVEDLPLRLRPAHETESIKPGPAHHEADYQSALQTAITSFEREFLSYHLAKNQGNISKTATVIGLSRVALHRKIKQYRIVL